MQPTDRDVARLRLPPQSIEAEQSVLGGLLLDNTAWESASEVLTSSDFYRLEHQVVFSAIGQLIAASRPADVVTVYERLEHVDSARSITLVYLNELAQSVPSASAMRRYAEIVRERAILRKLISATDEIAASAFNPQGREVRQLLDDAEAKVLRIGEEGQRGAGGFESAASLTIDLIDRVTELATLGPGEVTGVRTGFPDLDQITAGLQPGDLAVLAARPSMGKTALCMNFVEHAAIIERGNVLVFSMEMNSASLITRMAAAQGRIDLQHLRTGQLDNDQWGRLTEAVDRIAKAPLHINPERGLTVADLRARARRMARRLGGVSLIAIDYLQLMSGSGGSEENRTTEISTITRGLKSLAGELNCPVIVLSQLNRDVERRPNKRPLLSDLRDSGAIEQDADIVMFIYRDEYYEPDSREVGVAEVIIAKQRNGPTGTVRLAFQKEYARFGNLERRARYIVGGEE